MADVSVKLLGMPRVLDGSGAELPLPGKKARALLAYLAANLGRDQPRDRLATLLWGSRFQDQARQSLRQCLSRLRRALGRDDILQVGEDQVGLNAGSVTVDTARLEALALAGTAESLEEAASLLGDEFLAGLDIPEPEFEDWVAGERRRIRDIACRVWADLAERRAAAGEFGRAVDAAERLVALDPLREDGHRLLMRLYAGSGQRTQALRQYRAAAELIRKELQAEPEPETRALFERLRDGAGATATAAQSAPPADAPSKPTVAILPFANLGDDPARDYFADGVTDEIVNLLSRYRWLQVVSRNSSFAYKGRPTDAREIGEALGARYIIEGGVRQGDGRVRITAQLVLAGDGNNIWAGRFDRDLRDIFDLQDEIAQAIAAAIEPELVHAEGQIARLKAPDNLNAWDCYQRGLWQLYRFTNEGLAEAERLFGRAIAVDPALGRAHAGLAYVYIQESFYGDPAQRPAILDAALAAAGRAVACDDRDAIGHFALGRAHGLRREFADSIAELETAIELNPSFAQAYFALGFTLTWSGRPDEAIPLFEKAARLSPRDPHLWTFQHVQAMAHFWLDQLDAAKDCVRKAVRPPNATHWPFVTQAAVCGFIGTPGEKEAARRALLARKPSYSIAQARLDFFFAEQSDTLERYMEGLRRCGIPE